MLVFWSVTRLYSSSTCSSWQIFTTNCHRLSSPITVSLATITQPLEKLNRLVTIFLASLIVRQTDRVNNYKPTIFFLPPNTACLSNSLFSLFSLSPRCGSPAEINRSLGPRYPACRYWLLVSFPNPFHSIIRALILFCVLNQIDKHRSLLFVRN